MELSEVGIIDLLRKHYSGVPENDLYEMLKDMIKKGADVNSEENLGVKPLHFAALQSLPQIVQLLIENNADLNDQGNLCIRTPLQCAIEAKNLEIVVMLLYSGAEVSLVEFFDMTPLMYALYLNATNIAEVLLDFEDLSYVSENGDTALYMALTNRNRLAIKMIEMGADVNFVNSANLRFFELGNMDFSAVSLASMYHSAEVFKLIWPLCDYEIITKFSASCLLTYIQYCNFDNNEWIECLYLMLDSRIGAELVDQAIFCLNLFDNIPNNSLLSNLFKKFKERGICKNDRLRIMYLLLSLGVETSIQDFAYVHKTFGFNEELRALIDVGEYNLEYDLNLNNVIVTYILNFEKDPLIVYEVLELKILPALLIFGNEGIRSILNVLQYFSLPYKINRNLLELCEDCKNRYKKKLYNKLDEWPQLPSLTEMCRNTIRGMIKTSCDKKKPYKFFDMLNYMNLPPLIEDIICFRVPIYKL